MQKLRQSVALEDGTEMSENLDDDIVTARGVKILILKGILVNGREQNHERH